MPPTRHPDATVAPAGQAAEPRRPTPAPPRTIRRRPRDNHAARGHGSGRAPGPVAGAPAYGRGGPPGAGTRGAPATPGRSPPSRGDGNASGSRTTGSRTSCCSP
ncbi:hypothetical protein NKH77_21395 [Streptomyces sp. M19]